MRKQSCTKHLKANERSLPGRSGLQSLHGKSNLTLRQKPFSEAEEDLFFKLHALLGNRWALIAGRLPERTENEIKNYWNTHLKMKHPKNYTKKQNLTLTLNHDDDQVSDASSSSDGDVSMTFDINLDLSISTSNSSLLDVKKVQKNTLDESLIDCNKTLLLFQ